MALHRGDDDGGELPRYWGILGELPVVLDRRALVARCGAAVDPRRAGTFQTLAHHAHLRGVEEVGDPQQH